MRRIVYSVSSFLSCLAIVGCNFKGNTDMQRQSNLNCQKWDAFATKVGIQTCQEAYDTTKPKSEFISYLSKVPDHYLPDGSNYNKVAANVNEYVGQMFAKTKATEIVSLEKLSTVLKQANYEQQLIENTSGNFIALPYFERDTKDKPGSYNDLSAIKTSSAINTASEFSFYKAVQGVVDPTQIAKGTAYVIKYKLVGSEQIYSALLTIPNDIKNANDLPLMVYAHGGDAGLSLRNMATILQDNLGKAIVIAPTYPGEPICSVTTLGGSEKTQFQRKCVDENGNIIAPAVAAEGQKSPIDNDVVALLGLHNAVVNLVTNPDFTKQEKTDETKNVSNILKRNLAFYVSPAVNPLGAKLFGPKTIGISDSRGGATLLAAIGRSGIYLKNLLSDGLTNIDLKNLNLPPLFSASAHYYSPSSLLVGPFRIITQYMIAGDIRETSVYNQLPMVPDMKNNSYFTNYRLKPVGQDEKELNALIGWAAASDIVYLAPYMSVAMQDWNKNIPELLKVLNLIIFNVTQVVKKDTLPTAGQANPLKNLYNTLGLASQSVGTDNKSILTTIAENLETALKNPALQNASGKCNFDTNQDKCSIYNILVNGQDPVVVNSVPFPNLNPLLPKEKIPAFIQLLKILGNENLITNLFSDNLATDRLSLILPVLMAFSHTGLKIEQLQDILAYLFSSAYLIVKDPAITNDPLKLKCLEFNMSVGALKENFNKIQQTLPLMTKDIPTVLAQRKAYPGSIIFLHNTQDAVVPYSQSLIAKKAMDNVFDAVYATEKVSSLLTKVNIPALGSQFFAFQPEAKFYNLDVNQKASDGNACVATNSETGLPTANYSPAVKKCFGNYKLNGFGDGTSAHGDAAMRTSRLINAPLAKTKASDDNLKNALLYGNQAFNSASKTFIPASAQSYTNYFQNLNTLIESKLKIKTYYNVSFDKDTCANPNLRTGICYLNTSAVTAPLYNRSLLLDFEDYKNIFSGTWDDMAADSNLTPNDVLNAWMDSSVQEIFKN